ncbi:MAG: 3-isopropylmalate dehydratase [Desulfurococcales archaeon]|nr:3-isopropylmalate dehydratase [Desulfurococcales archaeon]
MALRVRGRAWRLGDGISTDHIISGKFKYQKARLEEMLPYLLHEIIPDFYRKVKPGDVIVAGKGFGYGSSREHAARLLKMAGVGAVVAMSVHRIFYRNAVNVGLYIAISKNVPPATETGDIIIVDLDKGIVGNETKGIYERLPPLHPIVKELLEAGGLEGYVASRGKLPWEADNLTSHP